MPEGLTKEQEKLLKELSKSELKSREIDNFNKYVDNAKDIKDNDRYAEYYSEPVRARLTSIIDQF